MDVTRVSETAAAARPDAGAERAAALAEARQRAGAEVLQSESASKSRQAEMIAQTRDAVAKAIGANTRLAIMRAESQPIFLYQAIDIDTGEVVSEWPHKDFAALLNSVEPGAGDNLEGLIVDSEV